ncbi:hypothetical protein O6H91_09G107800 [Diphasiastrum complanatum]|uniref:Uncharacterized protein n=1 Tax=Diphasiastrum complanatum TaxID=34168 RepID=A0ACC2CT22_DIPCM|nr:hypothetical protein O6H91_09G107800 [Diphasiastrum complanatum]
MAAVASAAPIHSYAACSANVATADYAAADESTLKQRGSIAMLSESEADETDAGEDEVDSHSPADSEGLAVASLGLPDDIVNALSKRGITNLFPIQRAVLEPAMQGRDLIARAKTGTGKTLAFGIPIINHISRENQQTKVTRSAGRHPRALVLAPTRELAKQVEREFMESAPNLSTICVYGGVSIVAQQRQLERGVDVAVGTPGRIIDLINRGSLVLREVKFVVLDEADQMLAVGFEEDVEKILQELPKQRQSMLFSATMPAWVKQLSKKYLRNPLVIDLVGDNEEKLAEGIKLFALSTIASAKRSILSDLIAVYGKGGKAIVFTQTKKDADDVALAMGRNIGCEALHGDISQYQREKTLSAFRDGKISVLVATDVAARGLDVPNVELIIHYEIPNDPETFVHRSGRTGRAGKEGTAILMYTVQQIRNMKLIEHEVGCKFELIGPPNQEDVVRSSAQHATMSLKKVHPDLKSVFLPVAQKLLESDGVHALAAAMACMCGYTQPPPTRSLLTQEEGWMTLQLTRLRTGNRERLTTTREVMSTISAIYPRAADQVGRIRIIQEPSLEGAVFDMPVDLAKLLLEKLTYPGDALSAPKLLPRLQQEAEGRGSLFSKGGSSGSHGGFSMRSGKESERYGERANNLGRFRFAADDKNSRPSYGSRDSSKFGGNERFGKPSFGNRDESRGYAGPCFRCGKPGHRATECPNGARR